MLAGPEDIISAFPSPKCRTTGFLTSFILWLLLHVFISCLSELHSRVINIVRVGIRRQLSLIVIFRLIQPGTFSEETLLTE
jgi:hypothetical protein